MSKLIFLDITMDFDVILALLALVAAAMGVVLYNKLILLRNRTVNGFSQIEVQLQRRYELIPNLVETARAYMAHEADTLTAVTNARNEASDTCDKVSENPGDAGMMGVLASADSALTGALGRFNMVVENYPDLKADEQMRDLGEELASSENRVAYARQAYSDSVMLYNTAREQFPAVIVTKLFSFKEAEFFEVVDPAMKQAVDVSFA